MILKLLNKLVNCGHVVELKLNYLINHGHEFKTRDQISKSRPHFTMKFE